MSKKLTEKEKQDKLMEIIEEQRVLIDSLMDSLRKTKSALDLIVANSKMNENANIKLIK